MDYMPFGSVNHDRKYKSSDWAWYFSTFISNGVFPNPSDGLQVLANDAMTILVRPGYGFISGYAFRNQTDYSVTLDTADGSLARIDRIVLRWDLANRMMLIAVLKGTTSASPTAPALTRNLETYELALADVTVAAGATSIAQSAITDQRFDSSLCGICAGIINQIDFSTLTAQFNSYFANFKETNAADFTDWSTTQKASMESWTDEEKAAFTSWFNGIKGILGEDEAGKLLSEINDLKDSVAPIVQKKTTVYNGETVTETLADGRKKITTYSGDTIIEKMYSSADALQWTKTTVYSGDTVTESIEEATA